MRGNIRHAAGRERRRGENLQERFKEEWMCGEGKLIKMYGGQVKRCESHVDKRRGKWH